MLIYLMTDILSLLRPLKYSRPSLLNNTILFSQFLLNEQNPLIVSFDTKGCGAKQYFIMINFFHDLIFARAVNLRLLCVKGILMT